MTDPSTGVPAGVIGTIDSTPDASRVAQISGLVRAGLALAAGFGLAVPTISDAQLSAYVSAGFVLTSLGGFAATAAWSWQAKRRQAQLEHAAVVESARVGLPLKMVVREGRFAAFVRGF